MARAYRYIIQLFVISFVLLSLNGRSQIFETDNSVDAKYTPPENSVFHIGKKFSKKNGSSSYSLDHKNLIKWNITTALRGNIAMEYERSILNQFSLMGSGGVTVFPDYLQLFRLSMADDVGYYETKLNGSSWFIGAEAKYFFDYVFDSDYICFGYRQFNYNLTFVPNISSISTTYTGSLDFTQNNRDIYFTYGFMNYINDNLVGEFSLSVGIKKVRSQTLNYEIITTGTGLQERYFMERDDRNIVTFFMSYKLGIAFGN